MISKLRHKLTVKFNITMPEYKIYILAFCCGVTDHSFIVTSAIPSPMSDNWNDNISPCKPTILRRFETIKMESMSKAFLFSSSGIHGTEIIMDGHFKFDTTIFSKNESNSNNKETYTGSRFCRHLCKK